MTDTQRTYAQLISMLADNDMGAITPQTLRDVVTSLVPSYGTCYWLNPSSNTASATYEKIAGTTSAGDLNRVTMPANNRLQNTGAQARFFGVATITFIVASGSDLTYSFAFNHSTNGILSDTETRQTSNSSVSSRQAQVTVMFNTVLDTDEYIELFAKYITSAVDLQIMPLGSSIQMWSVLT